MSALNLTIAGDGIAVVTLANPPMNAMDAGLLEELANLFEGLAADRAVRAAVIAADGPAFSAGLNLKTVPGLDRLGQRRLVDALNEGFGTLYAWPKPLVAAVNGHAIAGGLILALCADWRIVADVPLQISLAEVRVGVTYPVAPLRSPAASSRRPRRGGWSCSARRSMPRRPRRSPCSTSACRPRSCGARIAQAERHATLPPQAFATTKRELRAAELARIAAARAGHAEPRLAAWLGEEMRRASAAVLRASSAVLRGAA